MKKITGLSLILLLVMWLIPLDVVADNTSGDVNNDGEVNIADVNTVINYILGDRSRQGVDVNNDGEVNIADVNAIIGIILKGTSATEEHEYVDLGLPSGTLWATCNIGANSPEEYGYYFAWGETSPKNYYSWSTYKWCEGNETTLTKYCTDSYYGYNDFTDGKMDLDPEDDAAYVNWGPDWRMPIKEQQQELIYECTWTWTTQNGVNGQLGTGRTGNTIFLPAAGRRWHELLDDGGAAGVYWSRTLYEYDSDDTYYLCFRSDGVYWYSDGLRRSGRTVRAVRVSQN